MKLADSADLLFSQACGLSRRGSSRAARLAQREVLRVGGLLITEDRRASLCGSRPVREPTDSGARIFSRQIRLSAAFLLTDRRHGVSFPRRPLMERRSTPHSLQGQAPRLAGAPF
jgi:hypothetical protein